MVITQLIGLSTSPITKAGHTRNTPKLGGITIAPIISRLYDHILNKIFCRWYKPNSEQAGYRKDPVIWFILYNSLCKIFRERCVYRSRERKHSTSDTIC